MPETHYLLPHIFCFQLVIILLVTGQKPTLPQHTYTDMNFCLKLSWVRHTWNVCPDAHHAQMWSWLGKQSKTNSQPSGFTQCSCFSKPWDLYLLSAQNFCDCVNHVICPPSLAFCFFTFLSLFHLLDDLSCLPVSYAQMPRASVSIDTMRPYWIINL